MQALFVDQLSVIDFAYFHPQRGIVGESLILDVELHGELNDEGMLFDFSFVKKRIKSCVDNLVDHKFLVATGAANIKVTPSPEQLVLELTTTNGDYIEHISPQQAVYLLDSTEVTPEAIIQSIQPEILKILPDNVTQINLRLSPEKIEQDYYHYSHGLKKHFGDCQRIAHGHRSRIEVFIDNNFSADYSKYIAQMWSDIYLATKEDILTSKIINGADYYIFQYHANQGMFQLTIPQNKCYLLETDTTVELIADFLAQHIKQKNPNAKVKVKAYEGVDKGAIVVLN
ncbi:6-carboxytetrahydropterin synthase [Aliikangiella maris]|uniref:6-carboxytetrahydropterin synthase n=2 Tax=Aliikangiella maris TaxID=3162458 RepID=A0ABV3MRE0_9GAMM